MTPDETRREPQTTEFAEYNVRIFYHSVHTSNVKIIARSESDAIEIAKFQFPKIYTEKCKFDKAEIVK